MADLAALDAARSAVSVGVPDWTLSGTSFRPCDPEQALLAVAARQHGCATRDQAIACGLTADQISYRYRTGRWTRVGVRAFTIAGTPPSWEQQLAAGLLDLGREAVVSHRAAAALHGFDGFEPEADRVHRAAGRPAALNPAWRVHTSGTLDRIDRCSIGMFRCTTASRTIIDLARTASPAELERAIDSADP